MWRMHLEKEDVTYMEMVIPFARKEWLGVARLS